MEGIILDELEGLVAAGFRAGVDRLQVDRVACLVRKILDRVAAGGGGGRILERLEDEGVGARPTMERVLAGTAVELVVTGVAL